MANVIQVDLEKSYPRKFVPSGADMGDWAEIEPLFAELERRSPASVEELEQWLADYSELDAAISEEGNKRYIAMTTQTDDPVREAAYQQFVEQVEPEVKVRRQALELAYIGNPFRSRLPKERYSVMDRMIENSVSLFRDENVPLQTQEALLATEYQKRIGAMTVSAQGKELTLQQAGKLLEEPDRDLRRQVWEQIAERMLRDKEDLERLYDQLIALRQTIAGNAGFANFRDYAFRELQRFDYTPENCFEFHDAVVRAVLPLVEKILSERRRQLQVDSVRPWDLAVDPLNRPPLRPFATANELVQGTQAIFSRVDPALGRQFRFMADERLLELESRKGKAPGGYQSTLSERRVPFIFMNAVGRDADVRTLLHEGGHAFHSLAAREQPIYPYRHAPMEFSEVASMSMELLAIPYLGVFYKDSGDLARAVRGRLEEIVLLLPWIAAIDAFQHWVYTHPAHAREERAAAWLETHRRFFKEVDWSGYDEQRKFLWHRQLHLFQVPFYYIEYGIAQIGALQVWLRSKQNYQDAVARYWQALSLGGSRPLPELFAAAGGRFRFDYETLKPLMETLAKELDRPPA